jgi:LmbE family N-acetylglucosaminyl deacetylase
MITACLFKEFGRTGLNVLCLGAHADDIEIGCGGTLMRLAAEVPGLKVRWEVFSGSAVRKAEARRSARQFLRGASTSKVGVASFRESFFPEQWASIKHRLERIANDFQPDVVFTHHREDRHQDHRVLSELAWNTFRNHLILEYEIPKYEGDLALPNAFVKIPKEVVARKVDALMDCFQSQRDKHWFAEETFRGLMRIRGVECAATYAEAFHCRKLVL